MSSIDQELINTARKQAEYWEKSITDSDSKKTITNMIKDFDSPDAKKQEQAVDAFYKNIDFGTGGLRGLMGIGSNRINTYTLAKATRGLIAFCRENFPSEFMSKTLRFAIAYDTRNNSKLYAQQVATLLAAHGITVYFFNQATPTPVLSFTVRKYQCHIGIVITASHNPKEYNGYKVYFGDGGQIVPPHDKAIITKVNEVNEIDVKSVSINEVNDSTHLALIKSVDEEVKSDYQSSIEKFIKKIFPDYFNKVSLNLPIVFSSLHGTGGSYIVPGLNALGFSAVSTVASQNEPDGNFSTVVYPNPEEREALSLGLEEMQAKNAQLLIATDPDADRIGVAIRDHSGNAIVLNGNQIGLLLADFVLTLYKSAKIKLNNPYLVRTIVTTPFIDDIAKAHGVEVMSVLTGFKYIGELLTKYQGKRDYVFGLEESHGYLANDNVRDKDAVSSAYLFALMAAYYDAQKTTPYDRLVNLYGEYGYGLEKLVSLTKTGPNGQQEIKELMNYYEAEYGSGKQITLNGEKLLYFRDYDKQEELNLITGERKTLELPRSKVIQLESNKRSIITVRPSGTEPKIKYYFSVRADNKDKQNLPDMDKYQYLETQYRVATDKIAGLEKLLIKK